MSLSIAQQVRFVQLVKKTGRTSTAAFLEALNAAALYKVQRFSPKWGPVHLPAALRGRATARYETRMFDMRCQENGIEHRLTKIKYPWSNGQVERMNRTIKEATVQRYHYDRHDQLEAHLADFISAFDYARRLKTLKDLTPYEYVCKAWTKEPGRFTFNPLQQIGTKHLSRGLRTALRCAKDISRAWDRHLVLLRIKVMARSVRIGPM